MELVIRHTVRQGTRAGLLFLFVILTPLLFLAAEVIWRSPTPWGKIAGFGIFLAPLLWGWWWLLSEAFSWVEVQKDGLRTGGFLRRSRFHTWAEFKKFTVMNETASTAGLGLTRSGGVVMGLVGFFATRAATGDADRHHGLLLDKGFMRQSVRIRAHYTDQAALVQKVMSSRPH